MLKGDLPPGYPRCGLGGQRSPEPTLCSSAREEASTPRPSLLPVSTRGRGSLRSDQRFLLQ